MSTDANEATGILRDLMVVELGDEGTQMCGKLLADMGATVIKVEPSEGCRARHRGPYLDGHDGDPDASLYFWANNTSKDSVRLDLDDPKGREAYLRLLEQADVVLEDQRVGYLSLWGLAYEQLRERFPALIHVSVTPFGSTGPFSTWKGSDIVLWAMGGAMSLIGYTDPTTPPLVPQGDLVAQLAGQWACMGTLAALEARDRHGEGQHVDVSMQEVVAFITGNYATAPFEYKGAINRRADLMNMVEVCDGGYLVAQMLNITDDKWQAFKDWLVAEGEGKDLYDLLPAEFESYRPRVMAVVKELALTRTTPHMCELGQQFGFTWMAVNSVAQLFDDKQLRFRGFFQLVAHPELGRTFEYAGPGAEFVGDPWRIRRRPPLLGEDEIRWNVAP